MEANAPDTVLNNWIFLEVFYVYTSYILHFPMQRNLSLQPMQRKVVFWELTENMVYINHNAEPIKVLQFNLLFIWLIHVLP